MLTASLSCPAAPSTRKPRHAECDGASIPDAFPVRFRDRECRSGRFPRACDGQRGGRQSRMLRDCTVVAEGRGARFPGEPCSKKRVLERIHWGQGETPGEVPGEYAARAGDSERVSVVYRCRTDRVMRGQGNGDPRIAVRSTLVPTPPGHRLAANVAERTGQGETGHILHQRCVGCDLTIARSVAEGTVSSCCFLPSGPACKGFSGNLQATGAGTVPDPGQRTSCIRGTFMRTSVAWARLSCYQDHDRSGRVPSMRQSRDVSRPGAANRRESAR